MVPNGYSPDDPRLESLWTQRKLLGVESSLIPLGDNKIARNQRHLCPWCMESLYNHESIEKHHIVSKQAGGLDAYHNFTWMHKTCHQALTYKVDSGFFEKIKANLVLIKKIKKI